MNKLATYLSFVRFSHSVFALPFALTGALLAWREQPFSWTQVAWIVVCMVSARSAAMGFNRLVDAKMDALNPRTAMRELPRGLLSRPEADGLRDRRCRRCSCLRRRGSPRCASCSRRSRWRSCSGTRSPSGSRPTRRCSSASRWPLRRSVDGLPRAVAAAPSRGCSASPSGYGSAASTFSMPARMSTSIASMVCARSRRPSACRHRFVCRASCTWSP